MKLHAAIDGERWVREKNQSTKAERGRKEENKKDNKRWSVKDGVRKRERKAIQ